VKEFVVDILWIVVFLARQLNKD